MNEQSKKPKRLEYPMLLSDTVVFPGMHYQLTITDSSEIKIIEGSLNQGSSIFIMPRMSVIEPVDSAEIVGFVGVIAMITGFHRTAEEGILSIETISRARVVAAVEIGGSVSVDALAQFYDIVAVSMREKGLISKLYREMKRLLREIGRMDARINGFVQTLNQFRESDVEFIADQVADFFASKQEERCLLAIEPDLIIRLNTVAEILNREFAHMEIANKIADQTRKVLDKQQREYFLREQIKVIGDELGDDRSEQEEMLSRLENSGAGDSVKEKVKKDIEKLKRMNQMSPEVGILRSYIETVLDLPWDKLSADNGDLTQARAVLDADHYNMEDVKDRIIEHIAVMQLSKNLSGQILCLVGPPGVGKTSIAESVAKSLGREFIRVSLGGVRDESEIRGHRKTYIGAMPGKIISGLKKAGTINPVFLFDEIDKMSNDSHRGDPASAMLEVLDPVQNKTFTDHYLEVPYDLSKVLFICTANDESLIPWALQDRMEILRLSSYTLPEKVKIAEQFLLKRQALEHGIDISTISFADGAVEFLAKHYTKEAGVRELTRIVGAICRKVAIKIVNKEIGSDAKVVINNDEIVNMLGKPKYSDKDLEFGDTVGVVNGLSFTAVGGDILKLEVVLTPGKGELKLTGRLGDVMKESAQIAFSVVKHISANELNPDGTLSPYFIKKERFEKNDLHMHVPSGAIPKDGPSAGAALVVAMMSAFTGKKIRGDFAMTGEVTLTGRILEIGGVREKVLSAYRYGIKNVILPKTNEKSLDKVPADVKEVINFSFETNVIDVLDKILVK